MHAFQHQDSPQTLAEGYDEYVAANPGLVRGAELSPQAQRFFSCHDAVHVVFGCDVALDDEAVVKIASIFGTTGGFAVLRGYQLHETLDIYRQLRVADVLGSIARSVLIVPRTLARCLAQRARWPWDGFDDHRHLALRSIRQQFGIKVAH